MTKEDKEKLIKKWSPFLEGLNKSFGKQYKYAKIYEQTIVNNNKIYHKFLLSLLYNIFNESFNIKLSSRKNKLNYYDLDQFKYLKEDLFVNNKLIPEAVKSYNIALASIINKLLEKEVIEKIAYIKVYNDNKEEFIRICY
jgi:hypothetical protein